MTPSPLGTITAAIPSDAAISAPGTYLDSEGRTIAVISPRSSTSWVGPTSSVHHHGSNDMLILMGVLCVLVILGFALGWYHANKRWNASSH